MKEVKLSQSLSQASSPSGEKELKSNPLSMPLFSEGSYGLNDKDSFIMFAKMTESDGYFNERKKHPEVFDLPHADQVINYAIHIPSGQANSQSQPHFTLPAKNDIKKMA